MTLLRSSLLLCGIVLAACASPTEAPSPVTAQLALAAPAVTAGDSVAFTVTWTNRGSQRIELVSPVAYDVRLTGPTGRTEYLRAGKPALAILTPDMVVDGGASVQWRGRWRATQERGVYIMEAGGLLSDGRFLPLGVRLSFTLD